MQIEQDKIVYCPKKQLLTCRLCTDIFKKPVTLACGHTFCYNCLYIFMKSNYISNKDLNKQLLLEKYSQAQQTKNSLEVKLDCFQVKNNDSSQTTPLPLCPKCSSIIFKPIKNLKQNLALTNLIARSNYKAELKFQDIIYEEEVQNFQHKILIEIDQTKIEPLPFTHSEIRFSTYFLDQILEQSHSSYVVIEWPGFKKNIGLAGKIQRVQTEYHSSSYRTKENYYRGIFTGIFFVNIIKRKPIEINLKSRYYTQSTLYDSELVEFAYLTICKTQLYRSSNIQELAAFQLFFSFYDKLNSHHYLNQIYRLVDPNPLFQRNNSEQIIYSCIRILRFKPQERKQIIQSFDDHFRIQKINEFLLNNSHSQLEELFYVMIPGKYNSAFVFGVIFILLLLHYFQTN